MITTRAMPMVRVIIDSDKGELIIDGSEINIKLNNIKFKSNHISPKFSRLEIKDNEGFIYNDGDVLKDKSELITLFMISTYYSISELFESKIKGNMCEELINKISTSVGGLIKKEIENYGSIIR